MCTDPQNLDDVNQIKQSLGIKLPILLDYNSEIAKIYKVREYPTTFIIDPTRKIRFMKTGYSPLIKEQIRIQIQNLMAIKADAQ